jgi:hypothetical protein
MPLFEGVFLFRMGLKKKHILTHSNHRKILDNIRLAQVFTYLFALLLDQ